MPYVVIIPSFLASRYFNLLPLLATWFVSDASTTYVQGQYLTAPWRTVTMISTSYAGSMDVDTWWRD